MDTYLIIGHDRYDESDTQHFYVQANSFEEAYSKIDPDAEEMTWVWIGKEQFNDTLTIDEDGTFACAGSDESDILIFKIPNNLPLNRTE